MTCRTTGTRSEPDRKLFAVHPWQNRIHRSGRRKSASEYSAKIIKTLNYKAFAEGFALYWLPAARRRKRRLGAKRQECCFSSALHPLCLPNINLPVLIAPLAALRRVRTLRQEIKKQKFAWVVQPSAAKPYKNTSNR